MANVELRQIKKSLNRTPIIQGVDLTLESGAFNVLVGPSGCGKTTLLRLIAGLESIDHGSIWIEGIRVDKLHASSRGVAMVFQSYALYPHMTVYENMAFGLKQNKITASEIPIKIKKVAQTLQLQHLLDRKPKELSGGQRQRVAIGRAIVRAPKVFLFDEPLSNLDAKLRTQMRLELLKLHQHLKSTIVYVTHDQTEAMTMGERIVVLNQGKVEQVGTPMKLYQEPKNLFVADFIGSPAMNFLEIMGHVHPDLVKIIPVTLNARQPWTMGIRPEHLVLRHFDDPRGFPVTIFAIERLGYHTLYHVKTSFHKNWVVSVTGDDLFPLHQEIKLDFNPCHCHWFDEQGIRHDSA